MLNTTAPNMPETLAYAIVAALGLDLLAVLLLALHGDALGALLVLAIGLAGYWFLCREPVEVLGVRAVTPAAGVLLLVCAIVELIAGRPYYGILLLLVAAAFGFVHLLMQQGAVAGDLRLGGIVVIGGGRRRGLLNMLLELREAGVLTADEVAAKRAQLGL